MNAPMNAWQMAPAGPGRAGYAAGFMLNGSACLHTLARFYGLNTPPVEPRATVAQFVAHACGRRPRVGDRLAWERVELVVREVAEGAASKVCLNLVPLLGRRAAEYREGAHARATRERRGKRRTERPARSGRVRAAASRAAS